MSEGKRKIVQVDEDKLKRMIAGEDTGEIIENGKQDQAKQVLPSEKSQNHNQVTSDKNITAPVKKKKNKTGYTEEFLRINRPVLKRPTTIQLSEDIYRKIGKLLMFSPELSIAMFVNNVLESHFRENEEEIEEVIENGIRKLKENE